MSRLSRTRWTLIEGAKTGDPEATQSLIEKYRPAVVSYVRARGYGVEDAEDIAQEVFLRLFQKALGEVDSARGRFRSLVFAVTHNVVGHHRARAQAQKRGGGAVRSLGDRDPPSTKDAEEGFDRLWAQRLLELGLQRLAREHRDYHDAIQAFLLDGRSQAEIAAEQERSVGSVKNLIYRGKRKLIEFVRLEALNYSIADSEYSAELDLVDRYLPPGASPPSSGTAAE